MPKWVKLLLILSLVSFSTATTAKGQSVDPPVYIVQTGDTLDHIAYLFNISLTDLEAANGITNPDQISAGEQLVIPGVTGISGVIQAVVVNYGQNLQNISLQYQFPVDMLVQLNRITSPGELYAGSSLIVPQPSTTSEYKIFQTIIQNGESLLEAAASDGVNPWVLALANNLNSSWNALPGQSIAYQSSSDKQNSEMLSPLISNISIRPLPIVQGDTVLVDIQTRSPVKLQGNLGTYPLEFVQVEDDHYVAFQGIQAMQDRGLYPLRVQGATSDGAGFDYQQNVLVQPGYFPQDPALTVPSETMDPAVTAPEDQQIAGIVKPVSPTRLWTGKFQYPVDPPICINSGYGDRRSYNGSDYIYFHTGLDFGVCANLNIYAPASGVVVFTGLLTVRGNTTIIDHGWGVYSGLYHQSQILIQVGQKVEAGEKVGIIGATGRVNGPHLHWDLFINGIQVQPLDWVENTYP